MSGYDNSHLFLNTGFKPGDVVTFGRPTGVKTLGKVVKLNSVRLKVELLETRGRSTGRAIGSIWNVSYSLCRHAEQMLFSPVEESNKDSAITTALLAFIAEEEVRSDLRKLEDAKRDQVFMQIKKMCMETIAEGASRKRNVNVVENEVHPRYKELLSASR